MHERAVELKILSQPLKTGMEQKKSYCNVKRSRRTRFSHLSVHDAATAMNFIRESWKSGMSTTLLTMPIALNAGYMSGCNADVGLTTAFVAAFCNSLFSGSNHSFYVPNMISTPYLQLISYDYGPEVIPWCTILIGLIIYVCYLLRWHHLIEFMPGFVREGYFLGLGIIMFNTYIDYSFGLLDMQTNRGNTVYKSKIEMYQSYFQRGDFRHLIASFAVYLFLYFGNKINKPFPWVLISSCFGIGYSQVFPSERSLRSVYGLTKFHFQFPQMQGPQMVINLTLLADLILRCIPLALYILVQNLICAKGAETLTSVKCDLDQETQCVSIANLASGLLGGLPCNAQQRLYVLNIKVKETNQWSQLINACSIFAFYELFGIYFMEMPLFIVGGQLLYSAYQCPTWSYVDRIIETRRYLTILKCTVIAVLSVYYGAIQVAIVGSLYALLKFAQTMSAAASEIVFIEKENYQIQSTLRVLEDGDIYTREQESQNQDTLNITDSYVLYRFNGSINYINVKNHVEQIKQLPECDIIAFSFRYVSVFDEHALDRLCIVMESLVKQGREIYLTGLHPMMIEEMKYNQFFKKFIEEKPQYLRFLCPE